MILSVDEYEPFVPEWNNNKGETDPIKIYHKNPTMPLYERLIPKTSLTIKVSPDGKSEGGETTMTIDNREIVLKMVTKIENLEVPIGGKNVPITSPEALFGENMPSKISGLVDEVGAYLQGILSKKGNVDTKKSE